MELLTQSTTSQIVRGEPIKDTARVLSRFDVIAIEHLIIQIWKNMQSGLQTIINALTDLEHPYGSIFNNS